MQFLRVGDSARVVKGSLRGELGTVVSTDHTCGSVGLEFNFDGCLEETEVSLRDVERVFSAGPYMGVEGHLIQMCNDVFHVCQETTKEVIEVSKYYLDRRPLRHTLKSHVPTQQHFEPPSDSDSIEIGDYIQVLDGKHAVCRVSQFLLQWFSGRISPRQSFSQKKGGYDIRPGDTVSVARGPEFGAQGLVQHIDFPNARLSLLCDGDKSLINVPIRFVIKTHNASLDSFKKDIGHEVFVIGGERKGYRGTLDSLSVETCHCCCARAGAHYTQTARSCHQVNGRTWRPPPRSVTPPVEQIPSSSSASVTDSSLPPSNGWSAWSSSADVEHDPSSSLNPSSSSALQPWSVDALDIRDSIEARIEKLRDTGPLPWLMSKEFSSKLLGYHILFKVSLRFMNDPFCGENGPAPEGCVAVFCTSNSAGAALEHYHIPASDLSPAPPRKKNQECLILDGIHRGLIRVVTKCEITKKNTVDIKITPTVTATLRSDQICLVERSRQMMQ
ncbi:hypothetical protein F4604DRAFT_1688533 [Suillus subluteus]|nr:hypothetical protein F4604DRAFT_1688533 [Suillus subluteus]